MNQKFRTGTIISSIAIVSLIAVTALIGVHYRSTESKTDDSSGVLQGYDLYVDTDRPIWKQVSKYRDAGRTADAELLQRAAEQPNATWLVGPAPNDHTGSKDIRMVKRTSKAAARQHAVPVYVLYAMTMRDACAGASKGGFESADAYMQWLRKVTRAVADKAIYIVEPDAIAHTVGHDSCLDDVQREERYNLLRNVTKHLKNDPHTLAVYLDAGHSEWFKNPNVMVEPLKKSGVDMVRGISVNVSFFAETSDISDWARTLAARLGGDTRVVIDTSRNGNGSPPEAIEGTGRWCNPSGRALGPEPTFDTGKDRIDAYLWIKNIGESDGDCFGYPPAGTFMLDTALELAKNAYKKR